MRRGEQSVDRASRRRPAIVGEEVANLRASGGRPVRSRLNRRSSVSLSASGEGFTFSFSSRARMKLSIGFRTHATSSVAGGATRLTGWKAHQSAPLGLDEVTASLGHAMPCSIQLRMLAISLGWSFRPGGIFSSPDCSTARTNRLSAGFPGLTAAPRLPPAKMASREVSASPLDLFASLWHAWQFTFRICWIPVGSDGCCADTADAVTSTETIRQNRR